MSDLRVCMACRGYELERRWCSFCKGAGVVAPISIDSKGVASTTSDALVKSLKGMRDLRLLKNMCQAPAQVNGAQGEKV